MISILQATLSGFSSQSKGATKKPIINSASSIVIEIPHYTARG